MQFYFYRIDKKSNGQKMVKGTCLAAPQRRTGTPRRLGPSTAPPPQQASLEPLGSQEPPTLSQKAPLSVILLVVRQAMTPRVVAHLELPADQRVVGWCSCVWYGECEPSIS
jgi:hypothetical protein